MNVAIWAIVAVIAAYLCFKFLRKLAVIGLFGALVLGALLITPIFTNHATVDARTIKELAALLPSSAVKFVRGLVDKGSHGQRTASTN